LAIVLLGGPDPIGWRKQVAGWLRRQSWPVVFLELILFVGVSYVLLLVADLCAQLVRYASARSLGPLPALAQLLRLDTFFVWESLFASALGLTFGLLGTARTARCAILLACAIPLSPFYIRWLVLPTLRPSLLASMLFSQWTALLVGLAVLGGWVIGRWLGCIFGLRERINARPELCRIIGRSGYLLYVLAALWGIGCLVGMSIIYASRW